MNKVCFPHLSIESNNSINHNLISDTGFDIIHKRGNIRLSIPQIYQPGFVNYTLVLLQLESDRIFTRYIPESVLFRVEWHLLLNGCNDVYAILIDMSIPSDEKRFFVIHLPTRRLVYSTYVAHGRGSGRGRYAEKFSDEQNSYCTTLGLYRTGEYYIGKHGDSYRMLGLEECNKNAVLRYIVIHSAWYVSEEFAKKHGRCGNSHGCPAVSEEAFKILKPVLEQKVLIYIFHLDIT